MCMHDTEAGRSAFSSMLSNSDGNFGEKASRITVLFSYLCALA